MPRRFWVTLLVLAAVGMPLAPVRSATVTSVARLGAFSPPAAPTGGVVGTGNAASCTKSNLDAALAGGGLVTFNCGGPATITFAGAYTIAQDTTINGGDVITLSGGDTARLFIVNSGATLRLQHLVLDGAVNVGSDGGAIANDGNLWLENSTIQNSFTDNDHGGGAIFSDGPVTITNSLLQNNQGGNGGGALYANSSQALVTISNSTFRGNQVVNTSTGYGGAIWVRQQAQVSITGGAILSNSAQYGGGLYLSTGAAVTLTGPGAPALVSGNSATAGGGGVYSSGGNVTLANSLLQNNTGGNGGALFANTSQALVTISNSTFSGNWAVSTTTGYGGAIWVGHQAQVSITGGAVLSNGANYGGGLYLSTGGVVTLTSPGAPALVSGNYAFGSGGGVDNDGGNVTLRNAALISNVAGAGAGLYNAGKLNLTNSTLSGNSAKLYGGGIYNHGALAVTNSTLSGNSALSLGGGIYNYNDGALAMTNSTLSGNTAKGGGGGLRNDGTLTLTNATLSGNSVSGSGNDKGGGGILSVGPLTVINSTLSGNSVGSDGFGGGLANFAPATLTNVTLNGNSVSGNGFGGGIYNFAPATLTNVTLSGNSAEHGGGIAAGDQTIWLSNTVVAAGPLGANCDAALAAFLVSYGYNLSNDATCAPFFILPGDLNNVNPNLGPLANNGGPTLTHRPNAPSPAIDAIPLGVNGCGTTLTTDQRGAPRPIGGGCDIGAVETGLFWLPLIRR